MTNKRPHIAEEWWTPDQVDLANDSTRVWDLRAYVSQHGYSFPIEGGRALTRLLPGEAVPEGAKFEPNTWDQLHFITLEVLFLLNICYFRTIF